MASVRPDPSARPDWASAAPGTSRSARGGRRGREPMLIEVLTLAQRRLVQQLAAALDEEHCTVDQWRVMRALADGEGCLMGELSQRLLIPQASLTRLVDALADDGWVYRRQSDSDRRRISVHLSRRGRTRLARLDALAAAHESALRATAGTKALGPLVAHLAAAGPGSG
ncbi:MarR family winged helix-turn-helix transcriptional regulator [Streptomyces sp. NPDC003697]